MYVTEGKPGYFSLGIAGVLCLMLASSQAWAATAGSVQGTEKSDFYSTLKKQDTKEVDAFLLQMKSIMVAMVQSYYLKIQQSRLSTLIDPERIHQDEDGAQGRDILKKARAATDKYRSDMSAYIDGLPKTISDQKQLSEKVRQQLASDFRKSLVDIHHTMESICGYMEESFVEMEKLVSLAKEKGQWSDRDKYFQFDDATKKQLDTLFARLEQLKVQMDEASAKIQ